MGIRILCAVLLGLPAVATLPAADMARELEPAQRALAAGDYDKAYGEYHYFARDKNNPLAAFSVALFHQHGWGRPVDSAAACAWFERAAAEDIPAACHFYAQCLEQGDGGTEDPAEAAQWYQRAADLGHHGSLCDLARLHMTGTGVETNAARAVELCRMAIARRVPAAYVQLGRYLLEGVESVRDMPQALACFQAAAQADVPEAQYYLGLMLRDGRGCDADRASARHWFESAAAQGHVPAYFPTADLYLNAPHDAKTGRLSPEELAKAYMWLCATTNRMNSTGELARAREMLGDVRAVMPEAWAGDLDGKVAEHLAKFPDVSENTASTGAATTDTGRQMSVRPPRR